MPDYRVAMEAAWPVRDVDDPDDAVGVAISEAGKQLNEAGLEYVEVTVGWKSCPYCEEEFDAVLVVAGSALVGILLDLEIYDVENDEHAARVAKSEVGGALTDIPLEVVEVLPVEDVE